MSDYTPTTEEVRDYWANSQYPETYDGNEIRASRAFDRWLTAHDAKVRAEQREADAQIAEAKVKGTEFLVVDGNEFRRGARLTAYGIAAAIRAVPANTNTEEDN